MYTHTHTHTHTHTYIYIHINERIYNLNKTLYKYENKINNCRTHDDDDDDVIFGIKLHNNRCPLYTSRCTARCSLWRSE